MNDKTEIKSIVIEIEGKELSLSLESVKKLKDLLDGLFKDPTPGVFSTNPVYTIDPYRYRYFDPWTKNCNKGTGQV